MDGTLWRCSKAVLALIAIGWFLSPIASAQTQTFNQWAELHGLSGDDAHPQGNPDGDKYPNALEYVFGIDPNQTDNPGDVAPFIEKRGNGNFFVYRVSKAGVALTRVVQSSDLKNWTPTPGSPSMEVHSSGDAIYAHPISNASNLFYALEVTVRSGGVETTAYVGPSVGDGYWEGLPPVDIAIPTEPPVTGVSPDDGTTPVPNTSKYPVAVGASLGAFTPDLLAEYADSPVKRPPLRSWMGWFLWGNGTPPPGVNPGPHATKEGYGTYDGSGWDYFNYQWENGQPKSSGKWNAIRLDQQPLYLTPFTLYYNWAPGLFGYGSQPLSHFPNNAHYWKDKKIVRGVNLSPSIPFFYQYGDKLDPGVSGVPQQWHQAWMYLSMRPLETTVIVPSNVTPHEMLEDHPWNLQENGTNDPFPYPVWDRTLPASQQTPFAIMADRIGDWDADLIWEATNPRATATYERDRYRRTAFNQPGQGNYLKMSVAQGSPFIWCETNNSRYAIFYNLIRTNLAGQIDNNTGTNAAMVPGGPWDVPGVQGVQYVLLYGDHVNPNQWYHEAEPWYFHTPTSSPGGFNQPPDPANSRPGQHNHTYTALFFRKDSVQPVELGPDLGSPSTHNGTDAHGNPFFYLEFKETGKNWFVVGAVPEMRYYHTGVSQDPAPQREAAAKAWAEQMGRYAFNFITGTRVNYSTQNMYLSRSEYAFTLANPYVAAGVPGANQMTASANQTVTALNPHQYQPLTLGPDQTQAARPEVVWNPLQAGYGTDFPKATLPNANRSNPAAPSRWDYWSLRGNLKTIITSGFSVHYPFQNFLPIMPPPDYERELEKTGISAILITNPGVGNQHYVDEPVITIHSSAGSVTEQATAKALVDPTTGRIKQIDVVNRGSGYPNGMFTPPVTGEGVTITIQTPRAPNGRTAQAYAQVGGGEVLAIFMLDNGEGYASVMRASQQGAVTDPAIIIPPFDANHQLTTGLATILEGGAGFDLSQPIDLTFYTNTSSGDHPQAEVVRPGSLYQVTGARGGVNVRGNYLSDGTPPIATAHIPPPPGGATGQTANVVMQKSPKEWSAVITDPDATGAAPSSAFFTVGGQNYPVQVFHAPGQGVHTILPDPDTAPNYPDLTAPVDVVFNTGDAKARIYPVYTVGDIHITSPLIAGYTGEVQVQVSGGVFSDVADVSVPQISFAIKQDGTIDDPVVTNGGAGIQKQLDFEIIGGRGFDAVALPVIGPEGRMVSVRLLHHGSHYLDTVYARIIDPQHTANNGTPAELSVTVENGTIKKIDVVPGKAGSGYTSSAIIQLSALPLSESEIPDPDFKDHPKGVPARFYTSQANGVVTALHRIPAPEGKTAATYLVGTENTATSTSTPALLHWVSNTPFARPSGKVGGFYAKPVLDKIKVNEVFYSSIISQYSTMTGRQVAPFGGAFFGESAPDGYGLGNQMSAATKFIGDLFHYQQFVQDEYQTDIPFSLNPSEYALNAAGIPKEEYAFAILHEHNPLGTLSGALKSSVQAMQRTVSNLFSDPPSVNNPRVGDPNTWKEEYFSLFDTGVGRIVINPTATQPVWGVVSSVENPALIPGSENDVKTGLSKWEKGMLWSGFGVSDQWNDQHYFYGYYLNAAAQAALFDRSWEPQITSKPSPLWADANQMGTAIDQLLMSLAYDPDNTALTSVLYRHPGYVYQKLAFFDQWKGHSWATGVSPGTTVATLDFANDPFAYWRSFGTDSDKFREENENSVFEGIQAWSATILWGGASDRKPIVDLGIYLYSTALASADAYFLDKNYNLPNSADNQHSWVPVTTVDSATVPLHGKNEWQPNTGFVEGTPAAYYTAPVAFGGAASTGQSLIKKPENTLNNFFYAFPTGSKFIQAFPPTPWTLGMSRNSTYMKKWAGAMMREEWALARDSSLYQPANWLSMAMTSALSGVPYNPGDQPYKLDVDEPLHDLRPYAERLWSNWVTANAAPGSSAALMPTFVPTSVMSFLLAFEDYGTPDWTYIAKVTNATGADDNDSVVFTAAFTRLNPQDNTVETTFVAFNPGWTTRYVRFHRIQTDGTIAADPVDSQPITVQPKRLSTLRLAPIPVQ